MDEEINPWPKKGNQLIKSVIFDRTNACLNFTSDRISLYAGGYKRAGDLLVKHVEGTTLIKIS
jgi:hypothetical protein